MSAPERKETILKLSDNSKKSTSFLRKQTSEDDNILSPNYEVSRLFVEWMKPFTEEDFFFLTKCFMVVIDSVSPENRSSL